MTQPSNHTGQITKLYDPLEIETKQKKIQNYLKTHGLDQSRMSIYTTYFTSRFVCSILPEILKRKAIHVEITLSKKDFHLITDILQKFEKPDTEGELIKIDWEEAVEDKRASLQTSAETPKTSMATESILIVSIWVTWCGPIQRKLASAGWGEDTECYVFPGNWSIPSMALLGIEGVSSLTITDVYGNSLKECSYERKDQLMKILDQEFSFTVAKKTKEKGRPESEFTLQKDEFYEAREFLVGKILPALDYENVYRGKESKELDDPQIFKSAQIMFSLSSIKVINYKERKMEKKWRKIDCISVCDYETSNVIAFVAEVFSKLKEDLWTSRVLEQSNLNKQSDEGVLPRRSKQKDECKIF